MSQAAPTIDLATSPGYLLKVAATALRSAMEDVLRPLGMTVTHYSCLEVLAQRPGASNSDLARATFVTRQSMNVLLQTLQRDGLVTRADQPASGRVLPTRLTDAGRAQLAQASAAVKQVENRMIDGLPATDRAALTRLLQHCITSLR
ncbi:MarR family winged helix-turn-helix transcriptional regulator [Microbacterium hatanonis]|jgi:DNA-binding MarR family transcriptional regulator|uniref:MarR family transcriptional regulator n=1 Tax=Microbacterium hatanonis TaxID=404366 RepID=A0A5C8HVU6_9MICO|nr:MarR family transcriptional regulator [Microbacterium hatanonis]TXK10077.1 MarR family transcriptional regulator [Microbacterium hatanonis]